MGKKRKRIGKRDVTYAMLSERYYLDDDGKVCSKRTGKRLKEKVGGRGYCTCAVSFGSLGICHLKYHRAVLMLHLQRDFAPKEEVNHINKNPSDNRPENLQVVKDTAEHNLIDIAGRARATTPSTSVANIIWYKSEQSWRVEFCIRYKVTKFGFFKDFREACAHRNKIANELGRPLVSEEDIERAIENQISQIGKNGQ